MKKDLQSAELDMRIFYLTAIVLVLLFGGLLLTDLGTW
jgi:hypothetical protein